MTGPGSQARPLDARAQTALQIIVQEHVRTGQPVSSGRVSSLHPEKLSSATIRSLMAELAADGYLDQPHASAGRVPTDRGYRQVVDRVLRRRRRVPPREARQIEEILRDAREIEDLLGRAGRLLAEMTHHVGVVLAPDLEQAVVEHVEFIRLAPRRLVAIFVSRSGLVSHRVLQSDEDLGQEELDRLSLRLRSEFAGLELPEVRRRLIATLREEHTWASSFGREAIDRVSALLEEPGTDDGGELIVEGASSLLEAPELADVERLRRLMQTLDDRTRLLRLLDRCLRESGVQVVIGGESADPDFEPASLVGSPYRAGSAMRGFVGIVGPRRMEYARAVAIVDHFARILSRALRGDGEDDH